MTEWLWNNKEWVFSGIGIVFLSGIVLVLKYFWSRRSRSYSSAPNAADSVQVPTGAPPPSELALDHIKTQTHILFIDDDTKFKVVDILARCGWIHTDRLSDISNIDDPRLRTAHIVFVDIQGVGLKLDFHAQGLGLAKAIKQRYRHKKVVIYSAQRDGDRFHEALRAADASLAKDADPYEFQQLAERLARDYWSAQTCYIS